MDNNNYRCSQCAVIDGKVYIPDEGVMAYRRTYRIYSIKNNSNAIYVDENGFYRNQIYFDFGETVEVLLDPLWPITKTIVLGNYQDLIFKSEASKICNSADGLNCKELNGTIFVLMPRHPILKKYTWEKEKWKNNHQDTKITYEKHLLYEQMKEKAKNTHQKDRSILSLLELALSFLLIGLIPQGKRGKQNLILCVILALVFSIFSYKWIMWGAVFLLYFMFNIIYKADSLK